jgi:LacI family transcriptional regulator
MADGFASPLQPQSVKVGLPRVLVVPTQTEQAYLDGIWRFIRTRPDWSIMSCPQEGERLDLESGALPWADAVVLEVLDEQLRIDAASLGIPVVDLIESVDAAGDDGLLHVSTDNQAAGRLAFEHFRGLGFRHFAYLPFETGMDSPLRYTGFRDAAAEAGFEVQVLRCEMSRHHFTHDLQKQAAIFRELPRPCGMLCFADWLANLALHALRLAGLGVPDDVAVTSVNNIEMVCESSLPPLTSVDINAERVGYLAAETAVAAVDGTLTDPSPVRVPPRGLVARRSTQRIAARDPQVADALQLIAAGVDREDLPRAGELASALGISRRTLDEKFCREIGHTAAAEIGRQRMAMILQWLSDGELPLVEIAARSGCSAQSQLCRLVRRHTGKSPAEYRAATR